MKTVIKFIAATLVAISSLTAIAQTRPPAPPPPRPIQVTMLACQYQSYDSVPNCANVTAGF